MRVLFISKHYWPESCDFRAGELAAYMAAEGHHVTVLTTFPNHPHGKVYRGYEQCFVEKEKRDGVTIVRAPMVMDHGRSGLRHTVSHLSLSLTSFIIGLVSTRRPDLVWLNDPPLGLALSGYLLSKLKRAKYVMEIQGARLALISKVGATGGHRRRRLRTLAWSFLLRRSSKVIVTSHGARQAIIDFGISESSVSVIHAWADERTFRPVSRHETFGSKFGLSGRTNVIYSGEQSPAQALDTVLDAAKLLRDLPRLQFVLVGSGTETARLLERAAKEGIDNVKFVPPQNASQLPTIFAWADAHLVHLRDDALSDVSVPSIVPSYLACGAPILNGAKGDTRALLDEAKCSVAFEPENPVALAEATRCLFQLDQSERQKMSSNARAYYDAHFSQRKSCLAYSKIFASIVAPHLSIESDGAETQLKRAA